ncbi:MAG: type II toxin-antitoxin system VapC family toxin [Gammaproteobacteria bacterium]
MRLLLDTHILLWWLNDHPALSKQTRTLIQHPDNTIIISTVTAWEITIKKSLGKLEAPDNLEEAVRASGFEILPIHFCHALAVGQLPRYHDDPFDRLLIAQATVEHLFLVTQDEQFEQYDVGIL